MTFEETLQKKIQEIQPVSEEAAELCRQQWDSIAKPLDGLGRLEALTARIAAAAGDPEIHLNRRAAVVMCADHGVVAEGVTQTGSEVTAQMAVEIAEGVSSVSLMAGQAGADVVVVDMGMSMIVEHPGIRRYRVGAGTGNIAREPAMSREEACQAVLCGMEMAERLKNQKYDILAAGEMGIGNTTTASAVICGLTGLDPAEVTGRGAGLDDRRLAHKIEVVRRAVSIHHPDPADPVGILSGLGGYDLAGMTGLFLGGARYRVPVIIDGVISMTSAALAAAFCPDAAGYMLPSHGGREPGIRHLLNRLDLRPVIDADLALGEGTGAVLLLPLLDAALRVYHHGIRFRDIGIPPYERF